MGKTRVVVLGLRRTVIYGLFIVALFCPLLLNGKDFTDSLFGIGFCGAAILLDLGTCWLYDRSRKPVGPDGGIIFSGLIFIVIISVQLPWAHRREKNFNKVVEAATKLQARHSIEQRDR
jgi:hypothetical protein